MTDPTHPAQTTVYRDNARPHHGGRRCEPGWHPALARLVECDYAFLPLGYDAPGCLFRGIDAGLANLLAGSPLGPNQGPHALAALEREAGVLFVSQDLSDAVSVWQPWINADDGAILVIDAGYFARAQADARAAVLGFADPGVVFRYPCFAPPLRLDAVRDVIVRETQDVAALAPGGPRLHRVDDDDRAALEAELAALCTQQDIVAARPRTHARYPRLAAP